MINHWLYKVVPTSRAEATGWRKITWALFGNDQGGLFGERDHFAERYVADGPSFGLAALWWLRNPAANLFKVVLRWPHDPMRVLFEVAKGRGVRFWFEREQEKWVDPGDPSVWQFTIAAVPPGFFYRGPGPSDGYWLWHSDGWLCFPFPTARPFWFGAIVYGLIGLGIYALFWL